MRFLEGGELERWWDDAYGGEWNFHTDYVIEQGETLLDALTAILEQDSSLARPVSVPRKVHIKFSTKALSKPDPWGH